MSRTFKANYENFTCVNCGYHILGDGYTNHCSRCLYSKHVDIYPGDRENMCSGLMKPVSIKIVGNKYVITHKCKDCGFVGKNKMSQYDNFDAIISISKNVY